MKSVFFDTNVLLYCFDLRFPERRARAIEVLEEHSAHMVLSSQVLQEFYWNAIRKLQMSPSDARQAVEHFSKKRVVQPDSRLILDAIDISERYRISFWDGLIVQAAVAADCVSLLTEDLNDGQVIMGIRIRNPFKL